MPERKKSSAELIWRPLCGTLIKFMTASTQVEYRKASETDIDQLVRLGFAQKYLTMNGGWEDYAHISSVNPANSYQAQAAALRARASVRSAAVEGARPVKQLKTPDGRYLVVRARLWRASNPGIPPELNSKLVSDLMDARREIKTAGRAQDTERLIVARRIVNETKIALGERGPVWWTDGAKDFNRHLVKNTPYADWYLTVEVP